MPVYGQAISEMQYVHRKFLEMLGPNEALELSSYFCLEIGRNHVFRNIVFVMPHGLDCFSYKFCLICLGKRRNNLLYHGASTHKIDKVP